MPDIVSAILQAQGIVPLDVPKAGAVPHPRSPSSVLGGPPAKRARIEGGQPSKDGKADEDEDWDSLLVRRYGLATYAY